ncbi:MAG TPA: serine hydrolase domain-containing protein [Chitinophagaceae bacterium]|nr:serine hydrolase domain-containing protein [Chitinophagaceae bacterium]
MKAILIFRLFKLVILTAVSLMGPTVTRAQNDDADFKWLKKSVDSILLNAEQEGFSGTILLRQDDAHTLLYKGYGYSDCNLKKKTQRDMIYDIGSITKMITTVAVLRLVQNQKLSLDQKVSDFIAGWPEDKKDISVLQLLTHSSGLKESLGLDEDTVITKEGFIEKVKGSKLLFHPGDSVQYSNTGYTILGYIIEQVANMPYEAYVKRELFDPLGIKKMGYSIPNWKKNEMVCGQLNKNPWGSTNNYFGVNGPSPYLFANGGMMANASELSRFFDALFKKELLPTKLENMMVSKLIRKTKTGNSIFYTSGSNLIFTSEYYCWMNRGISVVLLTNNSEYPKEKVGRQILRLTEDFINSNKK